MFGFWKKKSGVTIASPMSGKVVELAEVEDPTFGTGMLGKGVAIIPSDGRVYAPADGEIVTVFDTLHAISMITSEGVELLIHVGLDTVQLKGQGYRVHVTGGDSVRKGDLLLTADLEQIQAAGYDIITPVIVCNTEEYREVSPISGDCVEAGTEVITIQTK